MKKIIICLTAIIFVVLGVFTYKSALFAEQKKSSGFATITTSNAYLYRTPTMAESYNNKYFLLEKTYFVKVLGRPNDEFYQVEYMNIIGYVKVDHLEFVIETPINPYLDYVTLDINATQDIALLKSPNGIENDFNTLYMLPNNAKNLLYLGKISAVEQENFLGNIWYYCSFLLDNTQINGYIYAPNCCNLSPINKNSEVLTATSLVSFSQTFSLFSLPLNTENIIILLTIIPAIAFVLILSFPRKNKQNLNYSEE